MEELAAVSERPGDLIRQEAHAPTLQPEPPTQFEEVDPAELKAEL